VAGVGKRDRNTCVWTDDAKTMHNANPGVWADLDRACRHGPEILAPYDLGDNGGVAEHWLVCEALRSGFSVGLPGRGARLAARSGLLCIALHRSRRRRAR
jgi:hypothetical protein